MIADISDRDLHLFRGHKLGNGKQTLIFGPWSGKGNNTFQRSFPEGQVFEAHGKPPDLNGAVAAIEANQMRLYRTPEQTTTNRRLLKGVLLRLSYEQSTRLTSAAVLVEGMEFNVYLPDTEAAACRFSPGSEVWVGYDPASVAWF